ncbi:MAG: hypothetical protein HC895_27275 [Leptolyngbyaceae cyanobacterium SM1_3_5]|nr:hypothetical protein [Leptolyngbyaceae cyanobacterium SM1_3_5]
MTLSLLTSASSAKFLHEIRMIATDMDGALTKFRKFTPNLLQAFEEFRKAEISIGIGPDDRQAGCRRIVNYLPIDGAIAENGGL